MRIENFFHYFRFMLSAGCPTLIRGLPIPSLAFNLENRRKFYSRPHHQATTPLLVRGRTFGTATWSTGQGKR